MRFTISLICVPFFILTFYLRCGNASFWDGVVGISQIKQAAQYISGDRKGARQTYRNFWDQMPVVSQLKSIGQVAIGDGAGAQDTQLKFLQETVEPVLENTPVIGHIKSLVHLALGNPKYAYKVYRAASISTVMCLSAAVGGPLRAVYLGLTSQGVLTAVETISHGRYRPVGVFEYVHNFNKKKVGDHVDFLSDVAGSVFGGKFIKTNGIKFGRKHKWITWKGKHQIYMPRNRKELKKQWRSVDMDKLIRVKSKGGKHYGLKTPVKVPYKTRDQFSKSTRSSSKSHGNGHRRVQHHDNKRFLMVTKIPR